MIIRQMTYNTNGALRNVFLQQNISTSEKRFTMSSTAAGRIITNENNWKNRQMHADNISLE